MAALGLATRPAPGQDFVFAHVVIEPANMWKPRPHSGQSSSGSSLSSWWGTEQSLLFGVGDELENVVGVVNDGEIKTPGLVDPGLPAIIGFVVLLGPERGMMEVLCQELYLLKKRLPYRGRSAL